MNKGTWELTDGHLFLYNEVNEVIIAVNKDEDCLLTVFEYIENTIGESTSKWAEIRNDHFDEEEKCIFIDAWETDNDNEEGKVIAKIYEDGNKGTIYLDKDAETDEYAQEMINEIINRFESCGYSL